VGNASLSLIRPLRDKMPHSRSARPAVDDTVAKTKKQKSASATFSDIVEYKGLNRPHEIEIFQMRR
jgi:hypothetical protein